MKERGRGKGKERNRDGQYHLRHGKFLPKLSILEKHNHSSIPKNLEKKKF